MDTASVYSFAFFIFCLQLTESTLIKKFIAKTGKCVNDPKATHLVVDSIATCFYWCLEGRPEGKSCMSWSYLHNSCNISYSSFPSFTNNSECVFQNSFYERLEELDIFAYWRLNNQSKGFNYGTEGSAMNAVPMGPLNFTDDASVYCGLDPSNEGYNISFLAPLTLFYMTFFTWFRHTTAAQMVLYESVPSGHIGQKTMAWIYDDFKKLHSGVVYNNNPNAGITAQTNDVLNFQQWNFVAQTITFATRELYVNGTKVTSYTSRMTNTGSDYIVLWNEVYLGTTKFVRNHNYNFIGEMKCAGFAKRVLTEKEIQEVMTHCAP